MRMPSGYGSVVKLSGKRRNPFAVRTSKIKKFVYVYVSKDPALTVLSNLKKYDFSYKKKGYWAAVATDDALDYADQLSHDGAKVQIEYKQDYTYHAYFDKREHALKYLADLNAGIVPKDIKLNVKVPTFKEVFDMWVDYKKGLKGNLADSTWKNVESAIKYLEPLYNKRINTIKPIDIQPILNKHNNKSKPLVMRIKGILVNIQRYAKMQHYLDYDFTEYLVFEYSDAKEQKHSAISNKEINVLWEHSDNDYVKIILMNIYTGMRPSELLEIENKNVYLKERYLIGGKKTKAGINRTIPIHDKILPFIEYFYDENEQFLLHTRNGTPALYGNYYRKFSEIMENYGLRPHIPHDCRHTFATMMANVNADEQCVKMIMGHSLNGDITKSVYTHKTLEDLLAEINKI